MALRISNHSKALYSTSQGFTLIELVAVIVLIGILSVAATSIFSNRDGFADVALRDELIAAYRIAQQRAMYDHQDGICYSLAITAGGFEPQRNGAPFGDKGQVSFSGDYDGLSVSPEVTIYFDGLGNPETGAAVDCGGTSLATTLTVGAASLDIFSTGYIRAQ